MSSAHNADLSVDDHGSVARARDERTLRPSDFGLVAAVPMVVLAIFLLPRDTRLGLALLYTEPSLHTAYVSHFVHLDASHLLANLFVFLAVVPFSVLLSARSGRRRRFYLVAITVLAVFPFALSALNVLFPRPRIGFGLSGLNMAFIGYLPHVLVDSPSRRSEATTHDLLVSLFFLGTAIVAFRMLWSVGSAVGVGRIGLVVSALGSVIVILVSLARAFGRLRVRSDSLSASLPPETLFGGALFVLLILIGFPQSQSADGSVLNLLVHFLGYSFGYIVPYVAFRTLGIELDSAARSGTGILSDR